jgi:hypothetical protein
MSESSDEDVSNTILTTISSMLSNWNIDKFITYYHQLRYIWSAFVIYDFMYQYKRKKGKSCFTKSARIILWKNPLYRDTWCRLLSWLNNRYPTSLSIRISSD